MIRPSGLQLAESCGHAARLAEQFPESSEAAENGTRVHADIAQWLLTGRPPSTPHGQRLAATWARPEGEFHVEMPVKLLDPETGEVITEGTTDFARKAASRVFGVDWKTGRPENVAPPADNLQLHAYGLATALELGATSYEIALCFLSADKDPVWDVAGPYYEADWWPLLERVRTAATRGPDPVVGGHCDRCYVRTHCAAWMLPAHDGASALDPFTRPAGLTAETAPRALQVVQAMKDATEVAEAHLKDWVREHGPIRDGSREWGSTTRQGRRSVRVEDVEAIGRGDLVRAGAPYEAFGWRKAAR